MILSATNSPKDRGQSAMKKDSGACRTWKSLHELCTREYWEARRGAESEIPWNIHTKGKSGDDLITLSG